MKLLCFRVFEFPAEVITIPNLVVLSYFSFSESTKNIFVLDNKKILVSVESSLETVYFAVAFSSLGKLLSTYNVHSFASHKR